MGVGRERERERESSNYRNPKKPRSPDSIRERHGEPWGRETEGDRAVAASLAARARHWGIPG